MKELLTTIKFAYQRAVRGYDDRVKLGYGLDGVLEDYLVPLRDFCVRKVYRNGYHNVEDIYYETVCFINEYLSSELNTKDNHKKSDEMWKYIGAHIGCYWD